MSDLIRMLGTTFLFSSLVPASVLVTLNVLLVLSLSQDCPALTSLADYIRANPSSIFWPMAGLSVALGLAFTALEDVVLGLFRGEYFKWLLTPLCRWHQYRHGKWLEELKVLAEKHEAAQDDDIRWDYHKKLEQRLSEFRRVYPERKDQVQPTSLATSLLHSNVGL